MVVSMVIGTTMVASNSENGNIDVNDVSNVAASVAAGQQTYSVSGTYWTNSWNYTNWVVSITNHGSNTITLVSINGSQQSLAPNANIATTGSGTLNVALWSNDNMNATVVVGWY